MFFLIENKNRESSGLKTSSVGWGFLVFLLFFFLFPEMLYSVSCIPLDLVLHSSAKSHPPGDATACLQLTTLFHHGGVSIYPEPSEMPFFGKKSSFKQTMQSVIQKKPKKPHTVPKVSKNQLRRQCSAADSQMH